MNMAPIIDVELASRREPEEGKSYKIEKVEEVKTEVRGYAGYRVIMSSINPKDKEKYTTMLWAREVASEQSKLGAFIKAFTAFFGDPEMARNTDNWIGKTIKFISWKPRSREIVVVE